MDISISTDGFRVTARHVHQRVHREIHDRVSLRAVARISGPAFVRDIAANFHARGRPNSPM